MEDVSEQFQHALHDQETHELLCPECDNDITHGVIVRKRKRELGEPSHRWQYSPVAAPPIEYDDNDPDTVVPYMLFEQESHDFICPVCDHPITGEVILQKRKRDGHAAQEQLEWRPQDDNLSEESPWRSPFSMRTRVVADTSEEDDRASRIKEQQHKRKQIPLPSTPDSISSRRNSTAGSETWREAWRPVEIEELFDHSEGEDPPLKRVKRQRSKSEKLVAVDPEEREVFGILAKQKEFELSCSDCRSRITYQVILKEKGSDEPGVPVGLLATPRGQRRRRKFVSYLDSNPWRTRYKRLMRESEANEEDEGQEEFQSRMRSKYVTSEDGALTEPLVEYKESTSLDLRGFWSLKGQRRAMIMPFAVTYFCILLFLWSVWWLLRII